MCKLHACGQTLQFTTFHKYQAEKLPFGGIYMFVDKLGFIYYIGKAHSFKSRLPVHSRWSEAEAMGARFISLATVLSEDLRVRLEKDLIQQFNPPLNVQHRSKGLADYILEGLAYPSASVRTSRFDWDPLVATVKFDALARKSR